MKTSALALLVPLVGACWGGASTAPPPSIAALTVAPESVEVVVRGTVQLTATMWDASGRAVLGPAMAWASSNPDVATVSATGLMTALLKGSTTVTVTCEDRRATAVVIVVLPRGV